MEEEITEENWILEEEQVRWRTEQKRIEEEYKGKKGEEIIGKLELMTVELTGENRRTFR